MGVEGAVCGGGGSTVHAYLPAISCMTIDIEWCQKSHQNLLVTSPVYVVKSRGVHRNNTRTMEIALAVITRETAAENYTYMHN